MEKGRQATFAHRPGTFNWLGYSRIGVLEPEFDRIAEVQQPARLFLSLGLIGAAVPVPVVVGIEEVKVTRYTTGQAFSSLRNCFACFFKAPVKKVGSTLAFLNTKDISSSTSSRHRV